MSDDYQRPIDTIEIGMELPQGSMPIRSIEIVEMIDENGNQTAAVRWQGTPNIVSELGMLEYAKFVLARAREESDDE